MAFMDLLVHVDQTPGALLCLRMAGDLAHRHNSSRLTALYVPQLDPSQLHERSTAEFGLVSAADLDLSDRRIVAASHETERSVAQELAAIKGESGLEVELRSIKGSAARIVPQHARFADLCIVRHTASNGLSADFTFSEAVLFGSGRPVLIVPSDGSFNSLGRHILVAWNSSRASARALNDALPLIERAERTTILAINPDEYVERYRTLAPEQIVEHVRRHSPSVEGLLVDNVGSDSISQVIQEHAHRVGADLLVAGAFGHPRLWEKLMGGVTANLLAQMTLPFLMSH